MTKSFFSPRTKEYFEETKQVNIIFNDMQSIKHEKYEHSTEYLNTFGN